MPTYIVYYSQGNSNGPFSIYLSGSSGLNLYASPVTRAELELGYTVTFPDGIPSSSVDVFDISYGCFTDQNIPFPSVSPSVTPSITVTPSKTPSITVSPSLTPSLTPSITVSPSITPPPSVTPSVTSSPPITPSPTPTISVSRTPSPTPPVDSTLYMGTCNSSFTAAYLACASYGGCRGYSAPTNADLSLGSKIYNDAALTSPFIGNNNWIAISNLGIGPIIALQVNSSGTIVDKYIC